MDLKMTLTDSNIEATCRACLIKTSSLSLFVAVFDEGETFNLWEVFENCTNIPVDENDKLPKSVCEDCLNELISVHYFIKKCKTSNDVLKSFKEDFEDDNIKFPTLENCESDDNIDNIIKFLSKEEDEKKVKLEVPAISPRSFISNTKTTLISSNVEHDENTLDSNLESVENEEEFYSEDNEQLLPGKSWNEKHSEPFELDTELLENIEIKRDVKRRINREKSRAWRERNRNKYHCKICFKPCPSQTRLTEHLRTHTKEKPFKCSMCPASFSLICNLTRHSRVHTGEKPYVCNVCNKGFTQSSSLSSHMRLHNTEKPYLCRCGKSFHPDTNCPLSLRRYLEKDPNSKNNRHDMCKECGTIYTATCHSNNHSISEDYKRFLCSACGKEFISKMGLNHHFRIHTGERPYSCEVCGKSFKTSTALRMHNLTHTGERPCICKICGKCFIQPAHLRYHLLLHTGVKEYACIYCSKAFALKGNLTQHLRTHTDETPHQCSHCFKGFRTSNSLKKHQKVHGIIPDISSSSNNSFIETV